MARLTDNDFTKKNTLDENNDYLLVDNATQGSAAVTVKTFMDKHKGEPHLTISTTATSGVDKDLKDALTEKGWSNQIVDGEIDIRAMFAEIVASLSVENRLLTKSETISVPSTTGALIKYGEGITLNAGVWVIIASVTFPANNTGYRRVGIGASDDVFGASKNTAAAAGGYETPVLSATIVAPTNTTTYYSYIQHNAGSTLSNAVVSWRAVRIA